MYNIEATSVNELFVAVAKAFKQVKSEISPRGLKTKELYQAYLTLQNPRKNLISLRSRNLSTEYLTKETAWYKSGSLNAKDIGHMWLKLADSNGTINSNYGFLVLTEKWSGKSQFEWCYDTLKKDINSRQAIMIYNQPRHKYDGVKDFPCTLSQSFLMRNGSLDSIVHMRSNDLIYGLSYDIVWFTELQIKLAKKLNVPVGQYYHFANSLHVYERHFDMIDKMSKEIVCNMCGELPEDDCRCYD